MQPLRGLAFVEIDARPAGAAWLAGDIGGPSPLRDIGRQAAGLHDPANRKVAPDHGVVVDIALTGNDGRAKGGGFGVGGHDRLHQTMSTERYAMGPLLSPRPSRPQAR